MASSAQLKIIIDAATGGAESALGSLDSKLSGLGKFGKVAAIGLGAAAAGAAVVGTAAIAGAAGVLKLTMGAAKVEQSRVTFGRLAEDIGSTADVMLNDLHFATRGMVSDADLFTASNKLVTMGLADSSEGVAQLAEMGSQLAIAMGKDAVSGMEEFALLLANQSIPRLDTFGISAAKVRARIAELMEADKDLTREQAFMQAVLEEGGDAMKRVGEQGEGAAADLARLKGTFTNIGHSIGRAFLPALGLVATAIRDNLLKYEPQIQAFAENAGKWLAEKLPGILEGAAKAIGNAADAIGKAWVELGQVFAGADFEGGALKGLEYWANVSLPIIGLQIRGAMLDVKSALLAGGLGILAAVNVLKTTLGPIGEELFGGIADDMGLQLQSLADDLAKETFFFEADLAQINVDIKNFLRTFNEETTDDIERSASDMARGSTKNMLSQAAIDMFAGWKEGAETGGTEAAAATTTAMAKVPEAVATGMGEAATAASTGMAEVATAVSASAEGMATSAQTAMDGVKLTFTTGWAGLATEASTQMTAIATAVSTGMTSVATAFTTGMTSAKGAVVAGMALIKGTVTSGMAGVRAAVTSGMAAVRGAFTSAMGTIRGVVSGAMGTIRGVVVGAMNAVKSAISSASSVVRGLGSAFSGVASAIAGAVGRIVSAAQRAATAMSNIKLPSFLTGHSPSPFENTLVNVGNLMREMSRQTIPEFNAALGGAGPSQGNSYYYTLNVHSNASTEPIAADFMVLEALAGA